MSTRSQKSDYFATKISDLSQALNKSLPHDRIPDKGAVFDGAEIKALCDLTEECIALREGIIKGAARGKAELPMVAVDFFKQYDQHYVRRVMRLIVETLPAPVVSTEYESCLNPKVVGAAPFAVKLFTLIFDNIHVITGATAQKRWRRELSERLGHAISFYQREINKLLNSDDPPDVRALSYDLLRMEIMGGLLKELGEDAAAAAIMSNLRVTARRTLNAASDSIEAYRNDSSDFNRFDMIVVITAIDDLVAVLHRVVQHRDSGNIQGDQELSHDTITRFIKNMGVLIVYIFEDIYRHTHDKDISPDYLEKHLCKVERIYRFCVLAGEIVDDNYSTAAIKIIRSRALQIIDEFQNGQLDTPEDKACLAILKTFLIGIDI